MPPEDWRQIENIFHAALEREPADRQAYIESACGGDETLRSEVEALLNQDAQHGALMSEPIENVAGEVLAAGLMPGSMVGPYRIGPRLGAGGMGEVYRAEDTRLDRTVAIKTLQARFTDRFEREARAISALNHPNICTLHDIGSQDGIGYLVMEYVDGAPLKGPLPVTDALRLAVQIASALEAAHEKGILHRDLKPGNILASKSGVKLLDFGLAKFVRAEERPADVTVTTPLTGTGQIIGTLAYMSPEQIEGKPADARSDIFSFGLVLYEMLAGRRAFEATSKAGLMAAILKEEPPPLNPGLPAELKSVIHKCLEKDRNLRYQHAAEIRTDLQRLQRNMDSARLRAVAIASASVAVLALSVAGYFYLHRTPKLTDKDTIVLADFINTTNDPVFDGTLRQAVAIQLEQSPFLKIMDDAQVQQDLRLMNLPPEARITNQIAHDICVRDAAAATIDGSIKNIGKTYVITVQAITCEGGATLARAQVEADDKEHVLHAVGTAATAMRARLGESRGSIQKLNRPLEQATTGSLEALQSYTAGSAEMAGGRFLAAVPFLERAIALDPNFAMAYLYLALSYYNAGDVGRSAEYTRKAFALIDRVSEYERDVIAAEYYGSTSELDKQIDALRVGIANYPRAWGFHNNLSVIYIDFGQFEEGLKEGQAAAQLQPNVEPPYRRLLDAYMCLDRLDEAKKVAESVRAHGIDGARIHQRFLEMAYIEGDQAAVAGETQWYAGKPEEYLSFGLQAANRNVLGQRGESSKLYQRAAVTALRRGLRNVAAGFEEADAQADALSDNCRTAPRLGRPALALAMCGDTAQAEKLAGETSKISPNGLIWNTVHLPEIRAAIELQRDHPAKAVELLASASPYERAYPETVYLRALAYLRLHKGAEAATEFRKILDHKGASWGSTWLYPNWGLYYSISYLGLARASALASDTAKARKAFQDFFALWKDADTDLPILKQARTEYERLR